MICEHAQHHGNFHRLPEEAFVVRQSVQVRETCQRTTESINAFGFQVAAYKIVHGKIINAICVKNTPFLQIFFLQGSAQIALERLLGGVRKTNGVWYIPASVTEALWCW